MAPQDPIRVQMPDGKIAEFPASTSPDDITKALSDASVKPSYMDTLPERQRLKIEAEQSHPAKTPEEARANREKALAILPAAAAAGAVALTGGVGLPAILAAGAGGAIGQGAKDLQYDKSPGDRLIDAGKSAAGAVMTEGAGQAIKTGLQLAGPKLTSAARSLWLKMAKIPDSVAKSSQVAKESGVDAAKVAIADRVLSKNQGVIGPKNLQAMKDGLDALDAELEARIAGSDKFVSRQELLNALEEKGKDIGTGSIGQEAQQKALARAKQILKQQPPQITVQDAQKLKQTIYRQWDYAAGAANPAEAMADKTTARALRGAIVREEPMAGIINGEMSRDIPATAAMEKAVGRTRNGDPVKLATVIATALHSPLAAGMSMITIPGLGSIPAQAIYNVGKALPTSAKNPANVIRLLHGLFGGQE